VISAALYSSTNIQAFANFLQNVISVARELRPAAIYRTNTTKDEEATPQPDLLNMKQQ
jgi:hypothetical protein